MKTYKATVVITFTVDDDVKNGELYEYAQNKIIADLSLKEQMGEFFLVEEIKKPV